MGNSDNERNAVLGKVMGESLVALIEQAPCRACGGKLMLTETSMNNGGMWQRGDVIVDVYVECQKCHGRWKLCLRYDSVVSVPGRGIGGGRGDKSL